MRNRRSFTLILVLTALLASCKVVRGPAGFWKSYQPGLITLRESDQGPWGGERSLGWTSATAGTFRFEEASSFASRNGWRLVSKVRYSGAGVVPFVEHQEEDQPAFLNVSSTIGRFESGWLREDPGTGETTPAFGFVQVSEDGTKMYVHHFWGNG